jgi:nicotinamide mononucleotide transporter
MRLRLDAVAFDLAGQPVSWAELLGFVSGILTVALAVAQRVSTFPVGIANNVFFFVLFADADLFADASLQIVYAVLSAAGWWSWLRLGPGRTELDVSGASPRLLALTAAGVIACAVVLVPVLRAAGDSAPALDGITTAMSLGAQLLLNLKKLETWYVWMAVDVVYLPLYLSRDLYLTALVYAVFLGLCVAGLGQWRGALRQAPVAA